MAQVTTSRIADIDALVPSWRLSLEAENKSPATVVAYTYGTTQLSAFLRSTGMPTDVTAIAREHIEAFLLNVIQTRSASTAETRYRGLRQFFAWCEFEGEVTTSRMARMNAERAR
jgi:site-specific recombinase XerD